MSNTPTPAGAPRSGNVLLDALPAEDRAALLPGFERVEVALKTVLEQPNRPIEHAYFPLGGMLSRVAEAPHNRLEIGIIGREGMTGLPIMLKTVQSPHTILVQASDGVLRMEADAFLRAIEEFPSLRDVLYKWIHLSQIHVGMTALANGRNTIEERLARWLVMCQDRLGSSILPLTHDFLSIMLGVHRPGVTLALHTLEGAKLVQAERAKITVRDREGLIAVAGDAYGVAEAEARRLGLC